MKNKSGILLRTYIFLAVLGILLPLIVLFIWSFTSRWPWPYLLPESLSLRAVEDLLSPHNKLFQTLLSSIGLSLAVAIISTIVGAMTARALVFYDFPGKSILDFLSLAPILVPATVFAMGIHVVFLKMSLADTVLGVIIVHVLYALPYSINIMKNITQALGERMEVQANVLGASPSQAFIHVSMPLLMPGILASLTMSYTTSIAQYFTTLLIGGGKVKTISTIMVPFISKGDRTLASAYALIFILSTLMVFLLINWLIKGIYKIDKE